MDLNIVYESGEPLLFNLVKYLLFISERYRVGYRLELEERINIKN